MYTLFMDACQRKVILNEIRDVVLLVAAGILMTVLGLSCNTCAFNSSIFWIVASFSGLMWAVLWKGNDYLGHYITTKVSWLHYPVKRFFIGMISTLGYSVLVTYALSRVYQLIFGVHLSQSMYFTVIITLIISLFLHGRAFLMNWRKTIIDAERLQKENIAAKYESLKNQVNPHFLFNSFNALSNLVHEDPDKAVKFIKQLSEVYRYVLDTRDREVVELNEELRFLQSYIYLQKIRFAEKLLIEIDLPDATGKIAPLALQILVENAIKHNIVSEDDPLTVKIYFDNGYLVVENNLQKKSIPVEHSAGVGLENICKRYEFLSNKKVEVSEDTDRFLVKLPLLPA
jgi:LytS/YehU family sensor histidine kinase